MKTFASFGLVVVLAVLGSLGFAPTAQADPPPKAKLSVSRHVLYSDQKFTATATANTTCDWVLEWNGDRRHQVATTLTATYTAPRVTRVTKIPLRGTCFPRQPSAPPREARAPKAAAAGSGASQRLTVIVPNSWKHTITITVLPPGSAVSPPDDGNGTPPNNGGELPDTGGPALWLLVAGLWAVLAGAVAVRSSPRRATRATTRPRSA